MNKHILFGWVLILGVAAHAANSTAERNPSSSPNIVSGKVSIKDQGNLQSRSSRPKSETVEVLVGAGDIASCTNVASAEATAKSLDRIPGTVFAAGDLAYQRGTDG